MVQHVEDMCTAISQQVFYQEQNNDIVILNKDFKKVKSTSRRHMIKAVAEWQASLRPVILIASDVEMVTGTTTLQDRLGSVGSH